MSHPTNVQFFMLPPPSQFVPSRTFRTVRFSIRTVVGSSAKKPFGQSSTKSATLGPMITRSRSSPINVRLSVVSATNVSSEKPGTMNGLLSKYSPDLINIVSPGAAIVTAGWIAVTSPVPSCATTTVFPQAGSPWGKTARTRITIAPTSRLIVRVLPTWGKCCCQAEVECGRRHY